MRQPGDIHGERQVLDLGCGLPGRRIHLQPLAILPIFLLGYFFAFLYQRSRSLWPSILMHMLMNALALGVALLAARMGIMPGTDPADFWSPLAPTPSWHSPLPTLTP